MADANTGQGLDFPSLADGLIGLPLAEAQDRLEVACLPEPHLIHTEPPRPRHPFPPAAQWRVVQVQEGAAGLALVIAPPIALMVGGA